MLFGKRKQIVKRILIVEDEPLIAFDNENMLGDAGYEIVATARRPCNEAIEVLAREEIHLILSDVRLRERANRDRSCPRGKGKGRSELFATGHPYLRRRRYRGRLPAQALLANASCARPSMSVDRISRVRNSRPPKELQLEIIVGEQN